MDMSRYLNRCRLCGKFVGSDATVIPVYTLFSLDYVDFICQKCNKDKREKQDEKFSSAV